MTRWHRRTLALLTAGVLASGCAGSNSETADGAPVARQLSQSDHCGLTGPGLVYIASEQDVSALERLPSSHLSLEPLRSMDFQREHIVIIGLGQKSSGGYGVTLDGAEMDADELQLTVALRQPPEDAMVTQALTTPCAVVAITPDQWKVLRVAGEGFPAITREHPGDSP